MDEVGLGQLPAVHGLLVISEGQTAVKAANLSVAIYENDYSAQDKFQAAADARRAAWANIDDGWKVYEALAQNRRRSEDVEAVRRRVECLETRRRADGRRRAGPHQESR